MTTIICEKCYFLLDFFCFWRFVAREEKEMKFYKDHYDVVIIGGALACLSAALQLQQKGINDILFRHDYDLSSGRKEREVSGQTLCCASGRDHRQYLIFFFPERSAMQYGCRSSRCSS